jgi:uncharacterized NAD(P)/FAD-binding protein YdhS
MVLPAEDPARVVVVGAGAAGALAALHLVIAATRRSTALTVTLVDPADRWGRGVAYGTGDATHQLNVPASGMSALPDDPSHYVRWRQRQQAPDAGDAYAFTARRDYGRYLDDTLCDALALSQHAAVRHLRCRATGIDRRRQDLSVRTDDGRELLADAVVVAPGLLAPGVQWAPSALRESPFFVADPWAPGALDVVRRDHAGPADVLLVGTGLTMVDVTLAVTDSRSRADRVVHAISRGGRLPKRHAPAPVQPVVPDISDWGATLVELRDRVTAHLESARRLTGDWRPGLDGLRGHTAALWERLDDADRLEFLAVDARDWNVLRHRIPPRSADALSVLECADRLLLGRAAVEDVTPLTTGGLAARLDDGSIREVGWVVNCTGPRIDIRELADPFLHDLLRPRAGGALGVVATAGMGVRTRVGRLVGGLGNAETPLWTLGSLRRGELWESIAVPEIRTQAQALATDILDQVAPRSISAPTVGLGAAV